MKRSFAPESLSGFPFCTAPLNTRRYMIMPRWSEYLKSNTRARKSVLSFCSILGGGIRRTISDKRNGTPSPVFPEHISTLSLGQFKSATSSSRTSAGRASGESILLTTGTMTSPSSRAMESVVSVCACTPCVASTKRSAPSTARRARDTS